MDRAIGGHGRGEGGKQSKGDNAYTKAAKQLADHNFGTRHVPSLNTRSTRVIGQMKGRAHNIQLRLRGGRAVSRTPGSKIACSQELNDKEMCSYPAVRRRFALFSNSRTVSSG